MASSDLVKKALQLKLQLTDTAKSATLLKTLQKLQDLDVSLDILAETGIGKTVNSLRKHKQVGELAKSLVRYWKKLVPKDSTSLTVDLDTSQDKHFTADDQITPNNEEKTQNGECLQSHSESPDSTSKNLKKPENKGQISPKEQLKEPKGQKDLLRNYPENQTPPIQLEKCSILKRRNQGEKNADSVTSKKRHQHHKHAHNRDAVLGSEDKDSDKRPKSKPVSKEKASSLSDTEKVYEEKELNKILQLNPKFTPELLVEEPFSSKSEDVCSKTLPNADYVREDRMDILSSQVCKNKKRTVAEQKELSIQIKRKSVNEGNSDKKRKKAKTKHDNSYKGELDGPSMSFESYLSYDLKGSKSKAQCGAKVTPKKLKALEKREPTKKKDVKSIKWPVLSENGVVMNEVKHSVMDLLNTPLPAFLPECDKPANVYYEKREEKDLCDVAEEAHFTGQRLNNKMQVYSGNKTTFLLTMMTLHQQCIRTLQNNIDLLFDTGGVPFEILEPVLERCTPEQLIRIEECNPCYIGVTDHLWGKHCQRDFRGSKLEEYESWKEMYVRLSEERERKFKRLTKTIVSAHSTKPKGRQVKMAFIHTVAKPPRDVRIQQEIYGTAGAIQQHNVVRASVKVHENRTRPSCLEPPKSTTTTNSETSNSQDPRKKTRVAPMMAKSLKAFKKQLGRR